MKKHENVELETRWRSLGSNLYFISEKNEAHRKEVPLRVTNGVDNDDKIRLRPVFF